MSLKDTINQVQAKIQGEIGRFLILKESIMSLPSGPRREGLMSIQNNLEGRAMKMATEANTLKESMNYKGLDILRGLSMANVNAVTNLVKNGAQLVKEMEIHKANVAQAVGSSAQATPIQASFLSSQLGKTVTVALAAFAVNWAWHKARSKARGKS